MKFILPVILAAALCVTNADAGQRKCTTSTLNCNLNQARAVNRWTPVRDAVAAVTKTRVCNAKARRARIFRCRR